MKKSGSAGSKNNRIKFIIGGGLFLVAVILMVISATKATSEFDAKTFEVRAKPMQPIKDLRPGMSVVIVK